MINPPGIDPEPGTTVDGLEVLRPVGRGGMATVLEVRDRASGERLALKLLRGSPDGRSGEARFVREFRTLARLHHPNICRVKGRGTWQGRPYYTMEYLEGRDLKAEVEAWADLPPDERWERTRHVLVHVARALHYVHVRGLIHRDVTPGNVMVLPDGVVKLMDFGVAKDASTSELTLHDELLGTVAYVAPEQISGEPVDARADLYSLGAVLYLMLTGRRPFQARTLAGYLEKHLHGPPRPPRELVPGVPPLLEDICLRLLRKDPSQRFASAAHLLQVLEGVASASVSLDPNNWPPLLVGRDEECARVTRAVASCADGSHPGTVIWLDGVVGMGKTRLARAAGEAAVRAGLRHLATRAEAGGPPLACFATLLDALRGADAPLPPLVEELFGHGAPAAPFDRFAAYAAFRTLLLRWAPALVTIDDMHLADPRSIELAEYLVRNTVGIGQKPVVWLFTRTPGVQDGALDGLLTGASTEAPPISVHLRPLPPAAVEQLVGMLVPESAASRALARRLHENGEGNPAWIGEMLRALVKQRAIDLGDGRNPARLTVDEGEVQRLSLPIPQTVRDGLMRRLRALSTNGRRVADLLAVARRELSLALLTEMTALGEAELLAALDELIDASLVRERRAGAEEQFGLAHTRLRDLLYAEITPAHRVSLHRRVGETLERVCRRQIHLVVDAIAWHFEQGEVPGKAYPYLLRAGRQLLDRSFAREADEYFARALGVEPDAREHITLDEADQLLCEVLLKRVEALEHLGRHADLGDLVERAHTIAGELGQPGLRARTTAARAAHARRAGDLDRAETLHREALELATEASDHTQRAQELYSLATIRWGRGDLSGAQQLWVEALAIGSSHRVDRAVAYGYAGLGFVELSKTRTADARRYFEQALDLFDKLSLVNPAVVMRCNLVELHHFAGNLRRGRELAERALAQAREAGSQMGIVHARRALALILSDLGHAGQAYEEADAALRLTRRLGSPVEVLTSLRHLVRAAWPLGDTSVLRPMLDEAEALALRFDNEGSLALIHAWRARLFAEQGNAPAARAEIARALESPASLWPYQACRMHLVLARAAARLADPAAATEHAEAALRTADAAGYRLYALKGHALAALHSLDEAAQARHRRVAGALARSLAANLAPADAERFLGTDVLLAVG